MLGITSEDEQKGDAGERAAGDADHAASPTVSAPSPPPAGQERAKRPRNVRLEVVPARSVWVCVVDARGTERVGGVIVAQGDRQGPFRSRSFRVTLGNGGGDLRINGRRRDTPERSEPIGYLVKSAGTTLLSADRRPTCG